MWPKSFPFDVPVIITPYLHREKSFETVAKLSKKPIFMMVAMAKNREHYWRQEPDIIRNFFNCCDLKEAETEWPGEDTVRMWPSHTSLGNPRHITTDAFAFKQITLPNRNMFPPLYFVLSLAEGKNYARHGCLFITDAIIPHWFTDADMSVPVRGGWTDLWQITEKSNISTQCEGVTELAVKFHERFWKFLSHLLPYLLRALFPFRSVHIGESDTARKWLIHTWDILG